MVYVLKYLTVHLREVYGAFVALREHDDQLPEWVGTVRVLSIGGGAGSDIAGFKNFVVDEDEGFYSASAKQFDITRLERVTEWDTLAAKVVHIFSSEGINFRQFCIHNDINEFDPSKYPPYDIIMMSYVISELDDDALDVLVNVISSALAARGVLVINDRNELAVVAKIERLLSNFNVVARSQDKDECWCGIKYPDELRELFKPKLNMKSVRLGAIVERL
ncbi:hypothetical protein CCR94_13085 [Rhodoblastus sphagnicola]|uniref:Methyltransferase type 12 domain-containing protein n=1 Tax=Rhodoblastus sphagnicola TaxID=333368 RepID=A0A2S6N6L6_9HYPH|nr:hypothetical protein [Rhodoblastus sphagnicola]MBB4197642.1 hypothetical protein [Rhodoblastus sphagnicola]PPQ30250.1 hypothetical protein CCR94_13085 [Rhodoblastus sphagnicola]